MKIYLDHCCYGRYLDDLSKLKIRDELEAIKHILLLCEIGAYQLFCSELNYYEANRNTDEYKIKYYLELLKKASAPISPNKAIFQRAQTSEKKGLKILDSMHLAAAETVCKLFFTVDDDFLKKSKKYKRIKY